MPATVVTPLSPLLMLLPADDDDDDDGGINAGSAAADVR